MGGLMSPIFTGLALGAAEQADENYDNMDRSQALVMAQRQKIVDAVAAKQDSIDTQAADTASTQRSYMAQYNIPPDEAYTLATDPEFNKLKPEDRQNYIQSLHPTGRVLPGTPRDQAQQLTSCQTVGTPGLAGILSGGSYNVPGVMGINRPATPAQQVYQSNGQELGTSEDRLRDAEAFKMGFQAVSSGQTSAANFMNVVKAAGGNPAHFSWFDPTSIDPKTHPDPVHTQETNDYAQGLAAQTGLPLNVVLPWAKFAKAGGTYIGQDAAGNKTGVFMSYDGSQAPTGDDLKATIIHTYNASNPDKPYTDPSVSPPTPQPSPVNGSTSQPVPGQAVQPNPTAPNNLFAIYKANVGLPKEQYAAATDRMSEVPKIITAVNLATAIANNDPNAIGLYGAIRSNLGGPLVNAFSGVSPAAGNALDNWLNVSGAQHVHAAQDMLKLTLQRFLLSEYMPKNTVGMGSSGVSGALDLDRIFASDDPRATFKSLALNHNAMVDTLTTNYALDLSHTLNLPQNLGTDRAATKQLIGALYGQGFAKPEAAMIYHKLVNMQQGQGPQQ